jgi:hypothetical protein
MELGERTEREMASLGDGAEQHLVCYHPQVVGEILRVVKMCTHYMSLLTLELDPTVAATRDAFRQAVCTAMDGVAVVGPLPKIPPPAQGAPQ